VTRGRDLFVELRTASPAAVAASVRQIVRGIDRRMPFRVETVADRVRESTLTERVMAVLAGGLGAAALLLACASLYGLLAYTVSRRRREIGVRLALGARHASVMWLVQRESLALTAAGIAAGLGATIVLARFVGTSLLFQTAPTDPIALGISAVVMLAIASAAAYVPARAALRIDPVRALRSE